MKWYFGYAMVPHTHRCYSRTLRQTTKMNVNWRTWWTYQTCEGGWSEVNDSTRAIGKGGSCASHRLSHKLVVRINDAFSLCLSLTLSLSQSLLYASNNSLFKQKYVLQKYKCWWDQNYWGFISSTFKCARCTLKWLVWKYCNNVLGGNLVKKTVGKFLVCVVF